MESKEKINKKGQMQNILNKKQIQNNNQIKTKEKAGITLIALVITVIVLIILAMVTIAMLTGPNGLLNKSTEARIKNDKGAIKDQVEAEVMGSLDNKGKINYGLLEGNLEKNLGVEVTPIDGENIENGITFEVERNGKKYTVQIDKNGKVTVTSKGEGSKPSAEPEPEMMLNPGDTSSKTEKNNYKDKNNKKATIPKDFKVSTNDHEIDTGLVVEAPDGSEFVWVPVETAITANESDGNDNKAMAVKDPTDGNNYRGILYNFSGTTSSVMTKCTTTSNNYREPAYLTGSGDYKGDTDSLNNGRVTGAGLKSEYKTMIENVAKYGGFYVGRYETSLNENKSQSKNGEMPMNNSSNETNWWGMYEKEKSYATNIGISSTVGSSMIWGNQYDAMMNWILKGDDATKVTENSIQHNKTTTGSTSGDVMNKIYDLGNNLCEWTLEAHYINVRVLRGGSYNSTNSPSNRSYGGPTAMNGSRGSRLTLYIL